MDIQSLAPPSVETWAVCICKPLGTPLLPTRVLEPSRWLLLPLSLSSPLLCPEVQNGIVGGVNPRCASPLNPTHPLWLVEEGGELVLLAPGDSHFTV